MIDVVPKGLSLEAVEVWFQDEARVGQRGTVTRMWAPKGSRPRVFVNSNLKPLMCLGQYALQMAKL